MWNRSWKAEMTLSWITRTAMSSSPRPMAHNTSCMRYPIRLASMFRAICTIRMLHFLSNPSMT